MICGGQPSELTPRDVLERLTTVGGGGAPLDPPPPDPDFIVETNKIYKRKY